MPGWAVPPAYSPGPVPSSNTASDVVRPPRYCPTLLQLVPFHFATLHRVPPKGTRSSPPTYSAIPVPSLNEVIASMSANVEPWLTPPPTGSHAVPVQRAIIPL